MKKRILKKYSAFALVISLVCTNVLFAQTNLILDGSFEGGTPSAVWTEYSTNFVSPLCTTPVCGLGGGSGPYSGTWWAWFGGIAAYEEGSVSQAVIIPAGNFSTLHFYLEIPIACDSPADFLKVIIDGTDTVYTIDGTSPLCGVIGYTLQTVSLAAYADGLSHLIEFRSIIYGTNGTGTNFFVDNISLFEDSANLIKGKLFIDLNSNNVQDVSEPNAVSKKVTEVNTGSIAFSQPDGKYAIVVFDTGNYVVSPDPLNYFNAVPVSHTAYFSTFNQIDSLNNFAYQPSIVMNDLCITITPMGAFRAGFNANYMINYENVGTTTLNPTVIFFPDNDVTFVSANPVANSVTTDSVIWNFGPLAPFQTGSITVIVNVNIGTPIGTLINSNVRIEPVAGDANTICNYSEWGVYTTGSIDPNDILVNEDTILTTQLSSPPFLDYIIRFQNTGNDTAFTVRVNNEIPLELDSSSFEFVASSHPVSIRYISLSRFLEFKFDNILLPDSNVNEPASHGFVRYRIKPNTTLVAGDSIKNKASIYFDFNAPVQTNTAVTEIVLPTGLEEEAGGSGRKQLMVFPNPSTDVITITFSQRTSDIGHLTISDLYGRELFQSIISNQQSTIKIVVSDFAKGIYVIQLNADEKVYLAKFVKQ